MNVRDPLRRSRVGARCAAVPSSVSSMLLSVVCAVRAAVAALSGVSARSAVSP
jgi:hypothetical protein